MQSAAMALSVLAVSKRCVVAVLLSTLLLSTLFLAWPPSYPPATLHQTSSDSRRSLARNETLPHGLLAANSSRQLASCEMNRLLGQVDRRNSKRTGYVLCLTYREQQTRAAFSMYSLQCWAKTLLVNIVEPFLHDSRLVVPLDGSQSAMPAFSDLFSLGQWDVLTTRLGFAPLAPWRQFLSSAPREVVVVHLQYKTASTAKGSHLAMSTDYKEGCRSTEKRDLGQKLDYLTRYGFRVVREVCVNFEHGDEITLLQFNTHVLGPYHPRDVSIVMNEWRGFSPVDNGKRVLISNACWQHDESKSSLYLRPSPHVYCEASNYKKMYLGGGHDYISVIIRTEKVRLSVNSEQEFQECLEKTLNLLKSVQKTTKLKTTFLSMDIGKYGSSSDASSFKQFNYSNFISGVYGEAASVEMWEETFERVSATREAGYIALLQKVLVAEAHCLVVVGGGSFQKHAVLLHRMASKRRGQAPCVHVLRACSKNIGARGL